MSFFHIHKIKNRAPWVASCFAILFLATTALTAFTPYFHLSQAHASGEQYVFYYPTDQDLLKKLQDLYDGGSHKNAKAAELSQTSTWSKGGIWGDQPVRMAYDGAATDDLSGSPIGDDLRDHGFVYSVTYKCDGGKPLRGNEEGNPNDGYYSIKLLRSLKVQVDNKDNKFTDQENYRSRTWVGQIVKYPAVQPTQPGKIANEVNPETFKGDHLWMSQDDIKKSGINIGSCLPAYTSGDDSVSNTPNYYLPDPRESEWPNLVASDASKRSGDSVASGGDAQPNCINSGSALGVFLCPIIDGLSGVSDWVFSTLIEGMLTNVPIGTSPDDKGYQAWQAFRLLGNIVLVGALLAMVFAQSFGERFIDAYALRKMAPRILVGAIAINLSIYLGLAAADITKIIGEGIGNLLTRPFVDNANFDFTVGGSAFTTVMTGLGGVVGAGVLTTVGYFVWQQVITNPGGKSGAAAHYKSLVPWANIGIWILLFIVIPVVLLALAVLVTIAIRQGLLVFLIIVAPIAIALYVLPGTEKHFRTWWSLFSKTLMVYPIIAIIFAMSDIMSTLIFNANSNPVGVLTGTIVMFLPLFLIPFSFRFAGGAIGAIYNAAQGTTNKGNLLARGQQAFMKAQQNPEGYFGKKRTAAKDYRAQSGLNASMMDPPIERAKRNTVCTP
jgi:hypothetical protein